MELLLTIVLASLVGSLHCAAMCGSLVSFCVASGDDVDHEDASHAAGGGAASNGPTRRSSRLPHVSYHAGRLLAYAGLGAAAGHLGQSIEGLMRFLRLDIGVAVLFGGSVVAWGLWRLIGGFARGGVSTRRPLSSLSRRPGVLDLARRATALVSGSVRRFTYFVHARSRRQHPVLRGGSIGLASALLPCGWLYAFVLLAAGSGSPLSGAALLAAFWLGTVPALALLAAVMRPLLKRLGRFAPALVTVAVVFAGLATVLGRQRLVQQLQPTVNPLAGVATPSCAPPCDTPWLGRDRHEGALGAETIDALSPPCHASIPDVGRGSKGAESP